MAAEITFWQAEMDYNRFHCPFKAILAGLKDPTFEISSFLSIKNLEI